MTITGVESDIHTLWRQSLERFAPQVADHIEPYDDFRTLLDEADEKATRDVREIYPAHLRILEEGIRWLAELHLALNDLRHEQDPEDSADPRLLSAWALVGCSCAYAVAVRRLVLAGLDSPAKAVLRSLREALTLCIVLIDDRDRASRYIAAEGFEPAQKMWSRELRPAQTEAYLCAIESRLTGGAEPDVFASFATWRKSADSFESQAIHPTYLMALFTAFPRSVRTPEYHPVGTLGVASTPSLMTLRTTIQTIWYFANVAGYQLIRWPNSPVRHVLKRKYEDRGWWNKVLLGRDVYIEIVNKYWSHHEGPPLTPKPDGADE